MTTVRKGRQRAAKLLRAAEAEKIINFATTLGFSIETGPLPSPGVLPGILIMSECRLVYDPDTSRSAGELLHEIGHLAILPQPFRNMAYGDVERSISDAVDAWMMATPFMTEEPGMIPTENPVSRALIQVGDCEAQAWSYSASLECGIDPLSVFHKNAYQGDGRAVVAGLRVSCHAGINGLIAAGMCAPRRFPTLTKWLQDATDPRLQP
jgi:hypothetical protein